MKGKRLKTRIHALAFLVLIFVFAECKQDTDEYYSYSDGSGNVYIITNTGLEYIPIEPAQSSSGIYDGGDYVKTGLSKYQFDQLKKLLQAALLNTSVHTTKRIKTSGMIIIDNNGEKKIIILKANCKEQLEIEAYLKSIID
jgi:hypothetical protein